MNGEKKIDIQNKYNHNASNRLHLQKKKLMELGLDIKNMECTNELLESLELNIATELDEVWRKIFLHNDVYYISNKGQLISTKAGRLRRLTPSVDTNGYQYYLLVDSSKKQNDKGYRKTFTIHKIVAYAFCVNLFTKVDPRLYECLEVHHCVPNRKITKYEKDNGIVMKENYASNLVITLKSLHIELNKIEEYILFNNMKPEFYSSINGILSKTNLTQQNIIESFRKQHKCVWNNGSLYFTWRCKADPVDKLEKGYMIGVKIKEKYIYHMTKGQAEEFGYKYQKKSA